MPAVGGIRVRRGLETIREHGQIEIPYFTGRQPMGILPDGRLEIKDQSAFQAPVQHVKATEQVNLLNIFVPPHILIQRMFGK